MASLVLVAVVGIALPAQAAPELLLLLEGKQVATDVAPLVQGDTVLLPMRAVAEAGGGTVTWDAATATATGRHKASQLIVTIDSALVTLNGTSVQLAAPIRTHHGRTMVPMPLLMRFLGVRAEQTDQRIELQTADESVLTYKLPDSSGRTVVVRATSSALDLPDRCSARRVGEAGLTVARLFNEGDAAAFANHFTPDFRWFSVDEISLTTRNQLVAYAESRHQAQEKLLFDSIEVKQARAGDADLVFWLRRQAVDRRDAEREVVGKAVYRCDTGQFFVWSMADS